MNPHYPYQPPPQRSGASINGGLLAIVAIVGLGYGAIQYQNHSPAPAAGSANAAPQPQGAPSPVADFKVYSQCAKPWGDKKYGNASMCMNGCGPASIAMAITALTGKEVTPEETRQFMEEQKLYDGGASIWTFPKVVAPRWGVRAEKITGTQQSIVDTIKQGGIVILSGHGQVPFVPTGGHYILIRGLYPNGAISVGNSASKMAATNQQPFNLASLMDNIHKGSEYALFAK